MHFVRRAAARAVSASPSSFLRQSRSIQTTPFVLRTKQQSALAQSITKRFYSEKKPEDEQSSVSEALESAKEYVSETVESVKEKASEAVESVKESVSGATESARENANEVAESAKETAAGAATAAQEYAPRGFGAKAEQSPRGARNYGANQPEPNDTIFVGNLLFDIEESDLKREFASCGKVEHALIARDERGLSKGFGYVTFSQVDEASAAIEAKHQTLFDGRRMVVNFQHKSKKSAPPNPEAKTLFIGNIPFEMSDADLNKLFRDIKNVIDVRVAIDRRSGQPRGFAHADFLDIQSAVQARDILNGKKLYGRALRVDYSGSARDSRRERPGYGSSRSASGDAESDGSRASF